MIIANNLSKLLRLAETSPLNSILMIKYLQFNINDSRIIQIIMKTNDQNHSITCNFALEFDTLQIRS